MSEAAEDDPLDDGSVTVVTSRHVKPGHEAAFEQWLVGIGEAAAHYPGWIGRRVTRPGDHERPEWVVVFKFDSYAHLQAWTESAERRTWLERVRPHVIDEFKETVLTGLERWFTLPSVPGVPPPPRYKMAIVTLIVVYPLSLLLGAAANRWLVALPPPMRSLIAGATMISLMTWVVMPRVTRLLKDWLYPSIPPA
jgi:antibiotic biosynthesis monooxygenase (ABM) superfamily enzyme